MTRLAALLAAFLFLLTTVRAAAPSCAGINLLDKLAVDDPGAHAEVLKLAAAVRNGEAVFWKIEKDGVAPSWLLGTVHVTDPRVTVLPDATRAALRDAASVALELREIRSAQEMAAATLRNARFMVLPPGENLWDLIDDSDEPAIRGNPNLPPGAATIFGYQPWVVATMLSLPLCEYLRKQDGYVSMDEMLARQAAAQGAELVGLETMEEQISLLSGLPMDQQLSFLMAVSRRSDSVADQFETLIQLYGQRRITAMLPLMLQLQPMNPDEAKVLEFVEKELIVMRNHRMADRAAALLAKGDAFIAVGALHLPGDEGLVELIRMAGYKVTPVN